MSTATRSSGRRGVQAPAAASTPSTAVVVDLTKKQLGVPAKVKSLLRSVRCTGFHADDRKVHVTLEEDGMHNLSLSASHSEQGWKVALKRSDDGDAAAPSSLKQPVAGLLSALIAADTIAAFARASSHKPEEWTGRDRPDNGHWKDSYFDWDTSNFQMTVSRCKAFQADGYSNAYVVLLCFASMLQHEADDQLDLECK
jgi:hypothetical protein